MEKKNNNNDRYGLNRIENVKMSPAFASMLLAAIDDYDWSEYKERTGELDEALLDEWTELLYNESEK